MAPLVHPDIDPKTPDEVVFVTFNVAPYLNSGATVSSVSWRAPGLSTASASNTDTACSIKVSGGHDGEDYRVTASVTTSDGETLEFTGRLRVRSSERPR